MCLADEVALTWLQHTLRTEKFPILFIMFFPSGLRCRQHDTAIGHMSFLLDRELHRA